MESAGFRWSSLDSAGVRWIPLVSAESAGLALRKKSGRNPQTPLEYAEFRWTPPGQNMQIWPLSHQHNPGIKSSGIRWNLAEHVGECTVLFVGCWGLRGL